jgi:thiosulfate/3-mercaptopyruvate sulfurtransferase
MLKSSKKFSKWGISPATQVVVYDSLGGAYAARLWWMLRHYGHAPAAVLDGGINRWIELGFLLETDMVKPKPAQFIPAKADFTTATAADLLANHQFRANLLLDARSPERYRGEVEPIDTVAGHIPDALNRFHQLNLQPDGTFKPAEQLRSEFDQILSGNDPRDLIIYCGSGVTSCHHILAMEIAGLPGARLYPGSWSEWIRASDRPVEKGSP